MPAKVTGTSTPRSKRAAAARPAVPVTDPADTEQRTPLMVIDGIDCTIEQEVPFSAVLQYMDDVLERRYVFGQLALAKRALEEPTYRALLASRITRTEWQQLADKITQHVFGAPEQEAEQGN